MASVYVIEIDGWGEVGPAIDVTNAEGFSDGSFTLTTGGTPPASDEIGAMIWVQGCDSVIGDGYYTLTAVVGSTFTMQADPAEVTVTSYSPLSGLARIEDHYKISDSMPSWVTGANAQARWFRDLIGVSESAGQRIKTTGGIASIDGFEFTMARRSGMAAILADTYLLASRGPVVLSDALSAGATTIVTKSAVPYAGESASSPSGTAQPAWVGTEAIDVRGTITDTDSVDGVTTYTMTHDGVNTFVTRGVLRSFAKSHAVSVAVYGAMPTPIGQTATAYVYGHGHASHADRTRVARGTAEFIEPSVARCSAQTIGLASALFTGSALVDDVAQISFGWRTSGSGLPYSGESVQSDGSDWKFCVAFGHCVQGLSRATFAATPSADGTESWYYSADVTVQVQSDLPMVKPAADVETWELYNTERSPYLPRWHEDIDTREIRFYPVLSRDSDGTIWARTPDIAYGGDSIAYATFAMCHVVFPTTWARSRNSTPYRFGASRLVEVNPVDAILEILTSTGYGFNGSHDNAPSVFGMAIGVDQIDLASFTTVGNRLESEAINASTVALLKDGEDLQARLDVLLQTYALALATTTTGDVRLIDLTFIDYDTAATLDEGDLVGGAAQLSIGSSEAVAGVSIKFKRPWVRPDHLSHDETLIIQAATGGITETLNRARGRRISINPWFAASDGPTSHQSLGIRWSRMIEQTNGVVGTITCNVDPGYSGQIGDTVAVTLPAFPNAQDSGSMSGALCRIVDRKHVSRPIGDNPNDEITLIAYGATADDKPRQWAPSGVVSSVTSKLVFDLEPTTYSGGINYDSDAVSFADGVDVDIYTTNWSLRSTVTPGTVANTAGNTVTLSVAAAGGSGDVTPSVGDKITLAGEQNQSVSEAAKWGWLSTSTPGYLWR